jgi:hypothetical protein
MVFNATSNNISAISLQSDLLVEETGGPRENNRGSQVTDKLYHIMVYTSLCSRFELTTSVVRVIDCIGSSNSNYHTITGRHDGSVYNMGEYYNCPYCTVIVNWTRCHKRRVQYEFSVQFGRVQYLSMSYITLVQ